MPKPTKLKKPDETHSIYHAFPYSIIGYAIYDWEMDTPIQYATISTIGATIRSLKKSIPNFNIIFYKKGTDLAFIKDKSSTDRYNK